MKAVRWLLLGVVIGGALGWHAHSVLAEPETSDPCVRQRLTFDRIAKVVTLVRTKTNNEAPCSSVQNEPLTLFLGEPL